MKRLLVGILCITIFCVGCSAPSGTDVKVDPITDTKVNVHVEADADVKVDVKVDPDADDKVDVKVDPQGDIKVDVTKEENSEEDSADAQETTLTFADLSKYEFEFCSGAGGWRDQFVIEKDGYFTGQYTDSEMGSVGEGYENGSLYCSNYSGHFTDLEKVDDYTYKMTLADISYKEEVGTEEILDGVRYIYTEAYALGGNDTFYVYLPGTPVSRFEEDVWIWFQYANESEEELTMTVIVDEDNDYGIYTYERTSPIKDAEMNYTSYKESYDYYAQKATELITTLELKENAGKMYEVSDDCLNYLWNIIRYNVEGEAYEQILAEQRQWVTEKEEAAKAAEAEWEGGSFAPVVYLDTQATMTMERCEELLEYIKENLK